MPRYVQGWGQDVGRDGEANVAAGRVLATSLGSAPCYQCTLAGDLPPNPSPMSPCHLHEGVGNVKRGAHL